MRMPDGFEDSWPDEWKSLPYFRYDPKPIRTGHEFRLQVAKKFNRIT